MAIIKSLRLHVHKRYHQEKTALHDYIILLNAHNFTTVREFIAKKQIHRLGYSHWSCDQLGLVELHMRLSQFLVAGPACNDHYPSQYAWSP